MISRSITSLFIGATAVLPFALAMPAQMPNAGGSWVDEGYLKDDTSTHVTTASPVEIGHFSILPTTIDIHSTDTGRLSIVPVTTDTGSLSILPVTTAPTIVTMSPRPNFATETMPAAMQSLVTAPPAMISSASRSAISSIGREYTSAMAEMQASAAEIMSSARASVSSLTRGAEATAQADMMDSVGRWNYWCQKFIKENQQVTMAGADVTAPLPTPSEGVVYIVPADMVGTTVM